MNLIYISPHFPPNFTNFSIELAKNGVNVLGIADTPYEQLDDLLKASLTDYYRVENLDDYNQVYRACACFIHKHGRIDRVESHNEYWMMHEARLREDFNIIGPDVAQTEKIKRKSEMKKIFKAAGAPVVEGEIVKDQKSLQKFIKKHGYPVFTKPDVGVGGTRTFTIFNEEDVNTFWKYKPDVNYFVEPFIDGILMTFDGIADQNGEIAFTSSLRSTNSASSVIENGEDLSFYIVREIPEDAEAVGRKVLKGFDIRAKFFHLEFLRRKSDNKLFTLEMNCRAPGGYTLDLINFANDISVYREWANIIAFNEFKAKFERKYYAAHIARREGKNYLHTNDDIFRKYKEKIASYTAVPAIFADVMGNEAFLVRSPVETDIKEMIEFIQAVK